MTTVADSSAQKHSGVRDRQCLIENLAILVWTGHQRFLRGELLSAHQYLTSLSIDFLLELLLLHNIIQHEAATDLLDLRRRIEHLYPNLAADLNRTVQTSSG